MTCDPYYSLSECAELLRSISARLPALEVEVGGDVLSCALALFLSDDQATAYRELARGRLPAGWVEYDYALECEGPGRTQAEMDADNCDTSKFWRPQAPSVNRT